MLPRIAIFIPLILAACGQDVRNLRLDDVDLANRSVVTEVVRKLSPADGAIFATYLAVHGPRSAGNCGHRLRGRDGKMPKTVGDAIALMRAVTAQAPRDEEA